MAPITPAYTAIGCNRFSNVSSPSPSGTVAFGAGHTVALWDDDRGVHQTLVAHKAEVSCVKFVDGVDAFVSGDEEGVVKVWIRVGEAYEVGHSVRAHTASVSALGGVVTDQGVLVLTGGSDAVVHVYQWTTDGRKAGQLTPRQSLNTAGKLPLDMALHRLPGSDATLLALATTERKIHIYTAPSPVEPFEHRLVLEGHEDWIRSLDLAAFPSPHGDPDTDDLMLASASQDTYIRLWRITRLIDAPSSAPATPQTDALDTDMLDDFERRMTGDSSGSTRPGTQLSTKAHLITLPLATYGINLDALLIGHEGWVTNAHWSPSLPRRLLTTSADNSMIIWAPEPHSSAAVWTAHHRFGDISSRGLGLFGALWVPRDAAGGMDVIANAWNGGFQRWRAEDTVGGEEDWQARWAPTGHMGAVKDLAWDPAGEYLVSVSTDQTTRIHAPWTHLVDNTQVTTWGEINRPQIHGYDMTCVAPISRLRFVSGADEKVVRVFDAPRGFARSMVRLGITGDDLESEATSVGASVPPLGLSNRALSKPVEADPAQSKGFNEEHISISDTLDSLPTEGILSSSTLWPEIEKLYGHGYELMAVAASPSGDMIATSCKATTAEHAVIRLYDTTTWQQILPPLAGHTLTITRIVFSPEGRFILSCSRDRTWRLFRKKRGELGFEPIAAEKPHARVIWDCAFSPDSSYFVTAARDKQFKLWRRAADEKWELTVTVKGAEAATAVSIIRDEEKQRDLLAVGYEDGTILVHAVDATATKVELLLTIPQTYAHVLQINRLAWRRTKDGLQLASCSEDKSVKVLDIRL